VAATAAELGYEADAREYEALGLSIAEAFNARFLDERTGRYAEGSQTAQAIALWFGIVPEARREAVLAALIEDIRSHDGHLDTGTMGTAALQHVLPDLGQAELMYEIATQTTFPSWGDQINRGATAVWETWGGSPGFSRNMKLFALIERFLYRDVAGLAPAMPGWERLTIRPRLTQRLSHARAQVQTVRGVAGVAWRRSAAGVELELEVPASSTAELWLPDGTRRELGGGRHQFLSGSPTA
jgi:alpha-L-rhamnosidase